MFDFSWKDCACLYDLLSRDSCLCNVLHTEELQKFWLHIFKDEVLQITGRSKLDIQLLNSTIIYMAAERYATSSQHVGGVCTTLCGVVENFGATWQDLLDVVTCFHVKDKFLLRSLLKAMSAIIYTFPEATISSSIRKIFELCQESILTVSSTSILNLLLYIINYKRAKTHYCNLEMQSPAEKEFQCKGIISITTMSITDVHYMCFKEMATNWNAFVQSIFEIQDPEIKQEKLMKMLSIWKCVNDEVIAKELKDLSEVFLNSTHVKNFFLSASNVQPQVLRLYVDIISQICLANSNSALWSNDVSLLSRDINSATLQFLNGLPVDSRPPSFCGSQIERSSDELGSNHSKCDVTTLRKIVLIILKVLTVEKAISSISTAFHQTERFVKEKMNYASNVSAHTWILNLFFDQDDLLLEAMCSVLFIYINLNDDLQKCNDSSELEKELNPHRMFMEFTFRLGYSHHILLEFLMSDETCALLFLTKYLKLILSEWKTFIDSFCGFTSPRTNHNRPPVCIKLPKSSLSSADENIDGHEDCDMVKDGNIKLVSYSSSSNSEEEDETHSSNSDAGSIELYQFDSLSNLNSVIFMLRRLRNAIEKLTEKHEFPYVAKPLIDLIKQCENQYELTNG